MLSSRTPACRRLASAARSHGPGRGDDLERRRRQQVGGPVPKGIARTLVQRADVRPRRSHAHRVRHPPVLERREPDGDTQRGGLLGMQPGGLAQLGEVTFPGAGQPGLVTGTRVDVVHGPPERRERTAATAIVPHAGGEQAAGARDARHLREPRHRIGCSTTSRGTAPKKDAEASTPGSSQPFLQTSLFWTSRRPRTRTRSS